MSEEKEEQKTEFSIEINVSNKNLQYRSDFNEAETIFWLESVKNLIIKNAFDKTDLETVWLLIKKICFGYYLSRFIDGVINGCFRFPAVQANK